jgi:hypothetical protein
MALKLPSFNLLRKAVPTRVPGVAGSKVGSLSNTQINRTGVTKTYATRGAARKAARPPGLLSRLKTKLTTPKPSQPKGLSKSAFGSTKTPKVRESFGAYNKRTASPKPLRPAGKRTFGQMINKKPKFGSMSKAPRTGESFGSYNKRVK